MNLKKENKAAILVSNEAFTGLKWFGIEATRRGTMESGIMMWFAGFMILYTG